MLHVRLNLITADPIRLGDSVRVDTVRATNGVIRSVEEYQLVFSSARKH